MFLSSSITPSYRHNNVLFEKKFFKINTCVVLSLNSEAILTELKAIAGESYVSNDPAILVCYSRDQSLEISKSPDFIVLPETTEQVSQIVTFAQENGIAVVPWSTGVNSAGGCIPQRGGIILDLKRMNKIIEIDEENMTATIQPGVNFGRIQVELLKRNLRVINPTAPASASCLANFLDKGIGMVSNKYGVGTDHIVNMELVLPDGRIIKTGSRLWLDNSKILAPVLGADISGLFHASMGIFGICTEMTVKVYPVPKHNGMLIIAHVKDDYDLTEEIMRAYVKEKCVFELFMWQDVYLATGVSPTNIGAYRMLQGFESMGISKKLGNFLFVCYGGETTEELEFHRELLTGIAARFQSKYSDAKLEFFDEKFVDFFKNILKMPLAYRIIRESPRIERIRGTFFINWFNTTLEDVGRLVSEFKKITTENMTGLFSKEREELTYFPDDLVTVYVQPLEYGRTAMLECDFFPDQADPESMKRSIKNAVDVITMTLERGGQYDRPYGGVNSGFGGIQTPRLGTYYELLQAFKILLDPNNIMNPGRLALPVKRGRSA